MSAERDHTEATVPAGGGGTPPTPPYQPPAVAWEEPFESTMATTCGFHYVECPTQPTGDG